MSNDLRSDFISILTETYQTSWVVDPKNTISTKSHENAAPDCGFHRAIGAASILAETRRTKSWSPGARNHKPDIRCRFRGGRIHPLCFLTPRPCLSEGCSPDSRRSLSATLSPTGANPGFGVTDPSLSPGTYPSSLSILSAFL